MQIMNTIADFLLSEWFWSLFCGWYYLIINTVLLIIFLKLAGKGWIRSLLLSFSAQFFSFILYWLIVAGLIISMLNWEYTPAESCATTVLDPLYASLALGLIHALLQSSFIVLINIRSKQKVWPLVLATFTSNIIASLFGYGLILLTMSYMA